MPAASLLYKLARDAMQAGSHRRIAIINAQACLELTALLNEAKDYQLQQYHRDSALQLQQMGCLDTPLLHSQLDGYFDLILVHPSKNRQQTLGWIAEALDHCSASGYIMLCAGNRHGAKGIETQLRTITDQLISVAKAKCRCFSFSAASVHNKDIINQWKKQAEARLAPELDLISRPGLFSWNRPDPGSELLLKYIPTGLEGSGMDLCCGNGFLSQRIIPQSPNIEHLHLIDHDWLALACAEDNLKESTAAHTAHWLDATTEALPANVDWIICNPPFHQQHRHSIELGQRIITRACVSLKHGGHIWIVANRKLPYETPLKDELGKVDIISQEQGYKIIHGIRA